MVFPSGWISLQPPEATGVPAARLHQPETTCQANSATSEARRVAETERYMAIPGQALAYKLGQLKISELRARAEQALGERFDLRKFHTAVLGDGPLPLDVLEAKIDRWIASQKGTES
jgi:uncharacterized protein (DUF885 family)